MADQFTFKAWAFPPSSRQQLEGLLRRYESPDSLLTSLEQHAAVFVHFSRPVWAPSRSPASRRQVLDGVARGADRLLRALDALRANPAAWWELAMALDRPPARDRRQTSGFKVLPELGARLQALQMAAAAAPSAGKHRGGRPPESGRAFLVECIASLLAKGRTARAHQISSQALGRPDEELADLDRVVELVLTSVRALPNRKDFPQLLDRAHSVFEYIRAGLKSQELAEELDRKKNPSNTP